MSERPQLTLADQLLVLVRRWPIVLVAVLVVVGPVLALGLRQAKQYESIAEILLTAQPDRSSGGITRPYVDPDRALQSEIRIVESEIVALTARQSVGSDLPPVHAVALGRSNVMAISTRAASPHEAQSATDAYVRSYTGIRDQQQRKAIEAAIAELERELARIEVPAIGTGNDPESATARHRIRQTLVDLKVDKRLGDGLLQVVRAPSRPTSSVSPKPIRNAALAIIPGLLFGTIAAFLKKALDDSLDSEDDVADRFPSLRVLGQVPRIRKGEPALAVLQHPERGAAEPYRGLRSNLGLDVKGLVLLVTSVVRGEGKTTTATNLAAALAEDGRAVLLVDGDLRLPRLERLFRSWPFAALDGAAADEPGSAGLWVGDVLGRMVRVSKNLTVLHGPKGQSANAIASATWVTQVLDELAPHFDAVVIDAPPMLSASETSLVATHVDGIVLVIGAGMVTERQIRRMLRKRGPLSAPIVGAVVNGVGRSTDGYYGRY
jgi:capsular exopolysaccharide synthesis family protein